jgi:hypothetical protein
VAACLQHTYARFLEAHHPSKVPPVPIEEIVEFSLGMDVVPLPNLYRDFQIESWLSHDTRTIFVDLRQCEEMETRRVALLEIREDIVSIGRTS